MGAICDAVGTGGSGLHYVNRQLVSFPLNGRIIQKAGTSAPLLLLLFRSEARACRPLHPVRRPLPVLDDLCAGRKSIGQPVSATHRESCKARRRGNCDRYSRGPQRVVGRTGTAVGRCAGSLLDQTIGPLALLTKASVDIAGLDEASRPSRWRWASGPGGNARMGGGGRTGPPQAALSDALGGVRDSGKRADG